MFYPVMHLLVLCFGADAAPILTPEGDSSRIKSAAIFRQPADLDGLAGLKSHLIRRVPCLDDEIVVSGHPQAGAEDIAHIDELKHFGFKRMRAFL